MNCPKLHKTKNWKLVLYRALLLFSISIVVSCATRTAMREPDVKVKIQEREPGISDAGKDKNSKKTASSADKKMPSVMLSVKPLDLSRVPSTEEIMAAGQLGGYLYPTHELEDKEREKEINMSFGIAIQEWNKHEYKKAVQMFKEHVGEYPDSPWASEAILHVGCDAQYTGKYTEAEASFTSIVEQNKGNVYEGANILTNKATLRMGVLKVHQNNFDDAKKHFDKLRNESSDWRDRTYAAHWLQRLSRYSANELAMLNCGNQALAYLLEKDGRIAEARKVLDLLPENLQGSSIKNLTNIASQFGYNVSAIHASPTDISELPLPAIMHIGASKEDDRGHYWILEKIAGDKLSLHDPQAGRKYEQSIAEFSKEWSGNALVFSDEQTLPGVRLTEREMGEIYGGCCGVPRAEDNQGNPGRNEGPKSSGNNSPCGAPTWSVNMVNMNLFVTDTPLWYSSPIGPSVEIKLSYNAQSAIVYYEPFGNKWQFNYASYLVVDTGGQVTVFMPDGAREIYSPDGSGGYYRPYQVFNTLTKIAENHFELKFPDDSVYVYNIPAGTTSLQPFLVEIRDAHGQKLSLGYDTNVHLTTITDALGRVTSFAYNSDGLITQVSDPFARSAFFEYDANRNLINITDMGGYWSKFTYDSNIYVTSIEDSRGKWEFLTELWWQTYRILVTNPLNGKEEYYYTGTGWAWYVSPGDYASPARPKTTYSFARIGGFGEINSISFPGGGNISFGYDSAGNRTSITDTHGHTTQYTYNNLGRITSTTDAKGNVTNMTYDANGIDLLQLTNGLGTVTMTYNGTHDITSITDRLGSPASFDYNGLGQKISSTDTLGIATTYAYNTDNLLQQVTRDGKTLDSFNYDAIGRVKTHTDATGLALSYEYNNLNNVTKITYPDGKSVSYAYSSCCPHLLDNMTDRSGRSTYYTYDLLKRLAETVSPEGGTTKNVYDANGNLIKLIDSNNNVTTFDYDLNNRLIKKTYADNNYITFAYDGAGLLTTRTNARGININYTYDENHNVLRAEYSDGTPSVTYLYDGYNRLTNRQDGIGMYKYTYDSNSRLLSIDGPWANDTLTYQYDAMGMRTSLAQQGGQSVSYIYDNLSRLTGIQNGTNTYSYAYSNASPLVQSLTRANGSVTGYQYDTLNRLTEIANKNSSAAVINQSAYGYNQQDVRSSENITNGNPITTFQNELITYDYNKVNQLLSSTNPTKSFVYDNDGNMTQGYTPLGFVFTAEYDAENRLKYVQYTDADGVVQKTMYFYSGDGFLAEMKKYENAILASNIRYVRDGFLAVQERDVANNVLREYAWGLNMGGGIGGLLNLRQAGQDYSYLYDGKGNVAVLIDSSQSVVVAYTYDTFGNLMSKSGALNQPVQFSTKSYDEKTGLSYYGYRFYCPSIGRWINKDPLGEVGGINLYNFVDGNPLEFIDPNGQEPITMSVGAAIIFTGGVVSGGFDAYHAFSQGHSLSCVATAFGKGFVSGSVGTGVGLLTGITTLNPFITAASGGLASSVTSELLNGWSDNSAGNVVLGTASAAVIGPLAGKLPGLRTNGRLPNLWTQRTFQNLGPNSVRLIGQEAVGGSIGGSINNLIND